MKILILLTVFLLGTMLGAFLARLHLANKKRYLSDLEEDVTYFQDILPSQVFFLRKENGKTRQTYLLDQSRISTFYVKKRDIDGNYFFRIKKEGNLYRLIRFLE